MASVILTAPGNRFLFALILSSILALPAHAINWAKKDFRPFGYHTEEHLWLCAAGTFVDAQTYQYFGMDRTPAITLGAVQILALGVGKEFALDQQPGVNDLIADSIGILIGTVANVTIHFDFPHSHKSDQRRPAAPDPAELEN